MLIAMYKRGERAKVTCSLAAMGVLKRKEVRASEIGAKKLKRASYTIALSLNSMAMGYEGTLYGVRSASPVINGVVAKGGKTEEHSHATNARIAK